MSRFQHGWLSLLGGTGASGSKEQTAAGGQRPSSGRSAGSRRSGAAPSEFLDRDAVVRMRVRGTNERIDVQLGTLGSQQMPGTDDASFGAASTYHLSGGHRRIIKTMPGETPEAASRRLTRPANTTAEDEEVFFVDPVILLPDGREARTDGPGIATVLMNYGPFRAFFMIYPEGRVRFLNSHNADLETTFGELVALGFTGVVEGTRGEVSQLPDGRFGVADNQGWIEYPDGGSQKVNHRYSNGNVDNIRFFERFLPNAKYILDADVRFTMLGRRDRKKYTFYAHEVQGKQLTSDSTGWERPIGLTLGRPEEWTRDARFASELDRTDFVARTRPNEARPDLIVGDEDAYVDVPAGDPAKRLAPSPVAPEITTLIHPDTRAQVPVRVGPNVLMGHSDGASGMIGIMDLGRYVELEAAGSDLMKIQLQRKEVHRMHEANPHARWLWMWCRIGAGSQSGPVSGQSKNAAPMLRDLMTVAQEVGLGNLIVTGRDVVWSSLPPTVSNNAGWVGSYLDNGRVRHEVYARTQYSAEELKRLPAPVRKGTGSERSGNADTSDL